jgi:hypothetical protein
MTQISIILVYMKVLWSRAINMSNKISEIKQCISIVMEDIRGCNKTYIGIPKSC